MAFSKGDIYTSSGTVMLQNFWTPYVSKYDTSSFYNWEQDNLPLYDLEERTYLLWEQQGFTTSAGVPGLSLTVSADTPALTLEQNTTIFTDVSSCIAAIPKVVRFPVLIEVCNFGDLGKLELHNFRIEEGGSIEIINRAAAKIYSTSADVRAIVAPTENAFTTLITQISSLDLSSTLFAPLADGTCLSSLALSSRVLQSSDDSRVDAVNTFLYPRHINKHAPLTVSLKESNFFTGNQNEFLVTPYESAINTSEDDTTGTLDTSSSSDTTSTIIRRTPFTAGNNITGFTYLNTLSNISVKNCDGPIYIRNFCVNGEATPTTGQKVGINIINSDVLLENCASVRCKEAGFKFNNSKVVLSRSAFAYRNYELSSTTGRVEESGIGFHAINSDVSISSLFSAASEVGAGDWQASGEDNVIAASRNFTGFRLDNSRLVGGVKRLFPSTESSQGVLASEQNTGFGIVVNNSQINLRGLIDVYGNPVGISCDNSILTYENMSIEYQKKEGLLLNNSTATLDNRDTNTQNYRKQVEFKVNGQHLKLKNNSVKDFAFKNNIPETYGTMVFSGCFGLSNGDICPLPAISVDNNSTLSLIHPSINSRNSSDSVTSTPIHGMGIHVSNNSKASLYGTGTGCNFVWGPEGYSFQQYTAGLYANNNSEINLHGPTLIAQFGVDVLAENNSVINIEPAKIPGSEDLAISAFNLNEQKNHASVELHSTRACLVANKKSIINLKDLGSAQTNWLSTANGTNAYAGNGVDYPYDGLYQSYIGSGSLQFYPNPQEPAALTLNSTDDLAGGLGFDPTNIPITFITRTRNNVCLTSDTVIDSSPNWSDRAQITLGGVCVRAVQDSIVNVKNVHFPVAPVGTPLDGTYYSVNGNDCEKLMIWNIADTSRLNASLCSVSGTWPTDSTYHGPSALWVSSDGGAGYSIASGAPHNTPDTGRLSVLDSFGAGSSVWVIPSGVDFNSPFDRYYPISGIINDETASSLFEAGINVSATTTYLYGAPEHTSKNKGIFRIYWSPKSSAKILQTDLSGYHHGAYPHTGDFSGAAGPAYHIFAQGYNCSAPLSAIVPIGEVNASGIAPDLLKLSYDSDSDGIPDKLWTSGFYYCQEFLDDNPLQCLLDESAGDTFANAKNASLGSSGRPRKVTIYRSRSSDDRSSESSIGDVSGAYGFKSASIFDLTRDN